MGAVQVITLSVFGGPFPYRPYYIGRFVKGVMVEEVAGPFDRYKHAAEHRRLLLKMELDTEDEEVS